MKTSLGPKTLASPTPVWVVCTYDANGRANGATIAWGDICCSNPPSLAISLQHLRHSHGPITANKAFTVNIPAQNQAALADYFGIVSGRDVDKFAATNLTAVKSDLVHAPYIGEFPLVFECALTHTLELGSHTLFVGEIKDAKADAAILDPAGKIDMEKLGTVMFAPATRQYYGLGPSLGAGFSIGTVWKK